MSTNHLAARGNRRRWLLAAAAAILTAAGAAGLGTFAIGYASQSATGGLSVTTGAVTIEAGTANTLTTTVSNLQPGDTAYRVIDLKSTTTLLSTVTLGTTDTYSGTKLSAATTGLQMTVKWCATAWTQAGTSPAFTYTCSGGATTLIAARDVLTSPLSLTGLNAQNAASALPTTDHLMISLALPTSSPSSDQTAQSVINHTFSGGQLTPPKRAR